ncbi:GyrI-like domain-containing protein [Fibrella forsythiae]|uniref:GyrI-like domain-containing protein n=1 Tax=Fibrella forsythiae TaxID=2817061 RepID=A0ABS3JE31_9BACT|nr:GyrI-like domain-containing protein [Fibrella forsythiae]MBO0948247.1 GyrI-like domain-containing protein [Fibrella forsythiae]
MKPRIERLVEKKVVGIRMTMSLVNDRTGELWSAFMPRRNELKNKLTNDLISMQVYQPTYFTNFKPTNEFEKWAAVEVTDIANVPNGMASYVLPGGLYAIFDYKGLSTDKSIFTYIFETWLPNSDYVVDNRPNFEVLGDRYKNNHPESEEEIWISIKEK